jgi:hypothetical protein
MLTAGFALFVLTLILTERVPGRVFYDQEWYHRPTIKQFVAQWPDFDFWHYLSATTPGYHLLMAAVSKFVSSSIMALQFASLAISIVLIWTLTFAAARRTAPLLVMAVCAPFMFSPYVVASAAWLLPDNIAWLGVLCMLLITLRPCQTVATLVSGGAVLLALVFVRQIHVWTAGLLWASAWLMPQEALTNPTSLRQLFFGDFKKQASTALLALVCTVPALVLLGLFVRFWGGPVPPVFQGWYHSLRPGAVVQMLALTGVWGVFFVSLWRPHLVRFWRTQPRWLLGILAVTALAGIVIPTNDFAAARHTGIWGAAERFPVIGHTSPVILGLMMLGIAPISALLFACQARQRVIFLAAFVGYAAACTANSDLFQRYYDPFILMMLALMTATAGASPPPVPASHPQWRRRILAALPALLVLFFWRLSLKSVLDSPVNGVPRWFHTGDPPPPAWDPAHDTEVPPCVKPPPPRPADRHFWPWR